MDDEAIPEEAIPNIRVLIWDLETAKDNCASDTPVACPPMFRLQQHLGRVQDVDFSCDDQYLCTLGGQDDNALVIWEVETGTAICGSPAAQDSKYRSLFSIMME